MGFDQYFLRLAGKVGGGDVMPPEASNPTADPGEAGPEVARSEA